MSRRPSRIKCYWGNATAQEQGEKNGKVCRGNEASCVKSDRMGLTLKWPQPHFLAQTQDEMKWRRNKNSAYSSAKQTNKQTNTLLGKENCNLNKQTHSNMKYTIMQIKHTNKQSDNVL